MTSINVPKWTTYYEDHGFIVWKLSNEDLWPNKLNNKDLILWRLMRRALDNGEPGEVWKVICVEGR